jgi:general secretion pathway protein J
MSPTIKSARGFTILELVVAMTLTAMLLAMLSAGLYSVVNDWQRDGSGLDATLDKALVVLQLDRALQSAFPHTYVDPERLARFIYFEGNPNTLSFISTVSPQRHSGLTAWQLSTDDKKGIELKQTPAFSDNPDKRLAALKPVSLLPNYTAQWHFLFQKNPDTKQWVQEWSGKDRQSLPIAVRLVLTPKDDKKGDEPIEIVAPIRSWRSPEIQPIVPVN